MQFTSLATGDPTSLVWTFGDGGQGAERDPKHNYKRAGIFTVSLMASNAAGADIETKTNLINVKAGAPPVAAFKASPLTGFAPLKVGFTDLSEGNIASWAWGLGDGAISSLQNPIHEYKRAGFFTVGLTVSGEDGSGVETRTNLINIIEGRGPTAAFFGEPLTGSTPFKVGFFDISSGEPANWTWSFGDGGTSSEQNPSHTYNSAGIFTVILTVSSKDGTSQEVKTNYIVVIEGQGPTAGFTADKTSGTAGQGTGELTVRFTDLSSSPAGEIVKREWDFGDGQKGSEQGPQHTYKGRPGDAFTVSLTVSDAKGGVNTATKPAFISLESAAVETPTPTPSPTPTPEPEPPCAVSAILEDKTLKGELHKTLKGKIQKQTDGVKASAFYSTLNTLRIFRDTVLSRDMAGIKLIKIYYQHSREVTGIMNSDLTLKSKATEALTGLCKILEHTTAQDSVLDIVRYSIPHGLETDINALLDEIAMRGSDELRADMAEARVLLGITER